MQTTCAVLTPRAVWCRARATAGLTKLCQLLALSAWHVIAQERSAGSSGKQISALRIEISDQSFSLALGTPLPSPGLNTGPEEPPTSPISFSTHSSPSPRR